jgi:hypothetical protein
VAAVSAAFAKGAIPNAALAKTLAETALPRTIRRFFTTYSVPHVGKGFRGHNGQENP